MEAENVRVVLELDPALRRRLKEAAALKGVSIAQYCCAAVVRELAKDEANGVGKLPASRTSFARLEARRDEILGDRVFSGDSTELIREASEVGEDQADDGRGIDIRAFERLVELRKKYARGRPMSDKPDHESFGELRREIFKGKPLSGNSVDLLREAREIRDKQMDEWA